MQRKHRIKFRKSIIDSHSILDYYTVISDVTFLEGIYKLAKIHNANVKRVKLRSRDNDLRSVVVFECFDNEWNELVTNFIKVFANCVEDVSTK